MTIKLNRQTVLIGSILETLMWGSVAYFCLKAWYPGFYFNLFTSWFNLAFLVGALLVLGPFLNVVVYKSDHRSYINDLSVVYLLKLCVLFLGLQYFYSQRPVLLVLSVDRLVAVQAHQVPSEQIPPDVARMMLDHGLPPVVAARRLAGDDVGAMLEIMSGAPDIEYRPNQYERFDYQRTEFVERLCAGGEGSTRAQCTLVEVPLVYQSDQYATAIFDVDQAAVSQVLLKDPW